MRPALVLLAVYGVVDRDLRVVALVEGLAGHPHYAAPGVREVGLVLRLGLRLHRCRRLIVSGLHLGFRLGLRFLRLALLERLDALAVVSRRTSRR